MRSAQITAVSLYLYILFKSITDNFRLKVTLLINLRSHHNYFNVGGHLLFVSMGEQKADTCVPLTIY